MNPWETHNSKIILKTAWFKVYKDQVTTPIGRPGEYTYMENEPFVIVVGISKKGWIMIRQYRYPVRRTVIEFPAGAVKVEETPLMAARREFKEETGFTAGQWTELGSILEQVSTNNCRGTIFLAEELTSTGKHKQREDGIDEILFFSPAMIEDQIMASEIIDAKTIAVYFRVKRHTEKLAISY